MREEGGELLTDTFISTIYECQEIFNWALIHPLFLNLNILQEKDPFSASADMHMQAGVLKFHNYVVATLYAFPNWHASWNIDLPQKLHSTYGKGFKLFK